MLRRSRGFAQGYAIATGFGFRAAPRAALAQLLLAVGLALAPPTVLYSSKLCLDALARGDSRTAYETSAFCGLGTAVIILLLFYYVRSAFTVEERTNRLADRELMRLMGGAAHLDHFERPEYLDQTQRIREDRWRLSSGVNLTAMWLRALFTVVSIGIVMGTIHPLLLAFPLFAIVSIGFAHRASTYQVAAHEATSEQERLRCHLFDITSAPASAKELRVFGSAAVLRRRHWNVGRAVVAARNRADWTASLLELREGLISIGGMLAGIAFVVFLASRREATGGDVLLVIGIGTILGGSIGGLVRSTIQIILAARTGERVAWLRHYADQLDPVGRLGPGPVVEGPHVQVPRTLLTGIELNDVSFRYPGAARPVLDRISVLLPAGATVALVGSNGAGKSTLVKLLLAFYPPTCGRLAVDGVDLAGFAPDEWRERVTVAFQDFARLEFTALHAVGVGDVAQVDDHAAVRGALRRAGAGTLPDDLSRGLGTRLGSRWHGGVDLSGGQWQQVALGRGQMRGEPLLAVFDEPTAALDPESEHELFEWLVRSARAHRERGTVTVIISHRFSTVAMADLILVLDDGRLAEVGSHADLMEMGGRYAEQYTLQTRAYR